MDSINPDFLDTLSSAEAKAETGWRRPTQWQLKPSSLISRCDINDLTFGTGAGLYKSFQPALEATEHELIIVTCFWARSASLDILRSTLKILSDRAVRKGTRIRVKICLSSLSLFQKLFHTQSLKGQLYPPSTWTTKLSLSAPSELSGLDLQIKSIFVKPFSVMHPKFIIIDRQKVLLPSCNVSWEDWFEGCIGLTGPVVAHFVEFWQHFWADTDVAPTESPSPDDESHAPGEFFVHKCAPATDLPVFVGLKAQGIPCVFLPSPYHINPRFRFPWQDHALPPKTPLNAFLLACFRQAQRSIYIQTPNLTSPPVLQALLQTLKRGVDVSIVTSEKLMILEQLVTAGTTTSRCVEKLVKRYQQVSRQTGGQAGSMDGLMEEGRATSLGRLRIEYYVPSTSDRKSADVHAAEPVQSHLKLTMIDDELVVLGSGNLDRASWYTSQELGVAFDSRDLGARVKSTLDEVLKKRKKLAFDSG